MSTDTRTGNPAVLVVGDLLLDTYLFGRCERISPEAPVQIVDVEGRSGRLGGAGNVAGNLRALEAEVALVSVVGQDDPAEQLRRLLAEEAGVDATGVLTAAGRRTPEKTRIIAASQQVLRYDQESSDPAPPALEQQILAAVHARLGGVGAVILSDYGKGVLTERVCREVIEACRSRGTPVLCDPKGIDFSKYRGATGITPNRKEASLAAGIPVVDRASLERAGRKLREACELELLLVTLGRDGMALFTAAGIEQIRAAAREVYDVSGAGDTVIAALARGLAAGDPLLEACQQANAAAGIVVGKFGAARATLEEIAAVRQPALTRQSARKVLGLERLRAAVERLRRAGKRVVFTNGCFDLIHAGHVKFLEDAAALGDTLIVGLNSDASIRRLKGPRRPIQDSQDRAALLAALQAVDYVVLFDDETPLALIRALAPDVLVKGQDYTVATVVGAELVQGWGGEVALLPIMADRSTSTTIRKIVEACSDDASAEASPEAEEVPS